MAMMMNVDFLIRRMYNSFAEEEPCFDEIHTRVLVVKGHHIMSASAFKGVRNELI